MSRVPEILESLGFDVEVADGRLRAAKEVRPSALPGEAVRVKRKLAPLVKSCRVAGRFVVGDDLGDLSIRAVL